MFMYLHDFLCSSVIAPKLGLQLVSQWVEILEMKHKICSAISYLSL
jgi:hypothetical protein